MKNLKKGKPTLIVLFALGLVYFFFLKENPPSIPGTSQRIVISLREPNTDELIVERTISDPAIIAAMTETFSSARSGNDHKCPSIGEISFISDSKTTTLKILPGHNPANYEFRLNRLMYRLPRSTYVESLIAAGIERADIRLDGHPDIDMGSDQSTALPE